MFSNRLIRRFLAVFVLGAGFASGVQAVSPQELCYQALLTNVSGNPVSSTNVTVKLDLYDAQTGGNQVATQTFTGLNLSTTGGYVNLTLNSALDVRKPLWVQLTVTDVAGGGSPETMAPRQKLSSSPFFFSDFPNRTLIVVPAASGISVNATPTGSISDPFTDASAAYAKAKMMSPSYANRVVIMLMPGQHVFNSTLTMDTQGIDLVGFGSKNAVVSGTANPQVNATATGNTGAVVRNLIFQATSGGTNECLRILDGRVQDVVINRAGTAAASAGRLVTIGPSTAGVTFKDFEIAGDALVNRAPGMIQIGLSGGFVEGLLDVPNGTPVLALTNLTGVGALSFDPAGGGGGGLLGLANVAFVPNIAYGPTTMLSAGSVSFATVPAGVPQALPNPAPGSRLVNCIGNAGAWTGVTLNSSGNVAGTFYAFLSK